MGAIWTICVLTSFTYEDVGEVLSLLKLTRTVVWRLAGEYDSLYVARLNVSLAFSCLKSKGQFQMGQW